MPNFDIEAAIVAFVSSRLPELEGRIVHYDDDLPAVTRENQVYGIVRAQNHQPGYDLTTGPTSRVRVRWQLNLFGTRRAVQRAAQELPGPLTAHYRHRPESGDPVRILGAHITGMDSPERAERPAGNAETQITLMSEVGPG